MGCIRNQDGSGFSLVPGNDRQILIRFAFDNPAKCPLNNPSVPENGAVSGNLTYSFVQQCCRTFHLICQGAAVFLPISCALGNRLYTGDMGCKRTDDDRGTLIILITGYHIANHIFRDLLTRTPALFIHIGGFGDKAENSPLCQFFVTLQVRRLSQNRGAINL